MKRRASTPASKNRDDLLWAIDALAYDVDFACELIDRVKERVEHPDLREILSWARECVRDKTTCRSMLKDALATI